MKLLFTAEALSSFNDIKKTHSREADLIKEVLKDMLAHPSSGEGNPVPLSGKWLQQYPHVYNMILQEFDLPADRTSAKYAVHWDIGQSWR
jgi:Txe/YoeB family toxin of Txe-Axe toxin-antitoxin module